MNFNYSYCISFGVGVGGKEPKVTSPQGGWKSEVIWGDKGREGVRKIGILG